MESLVRKQVLGNLATGLHFVDLEEELPPGAYMVKVVHGDKMFSRKV